MDLRAESVHVEELTVKAEEMAKSILAERANVFGDKGDVDIAFFPDIGIIGYRIRDIDLGRVNAGDLFETSAKITDGMQKFARSDAAMAVIGKGGITMGFFPIETVVLRNLR